MARAILVTGGAGFIGSHICKALAKSGFKPIAYDNLSTGHADAVRWGPFIEGDILDRGLLKATLKEFSPEFVIHAPPMPMSANPSKIRANITVTMSAVAFRCWMPVSIRILAGWCFPPAAPPMAYRRNCRSERKPRRCRSIPMGAPS